MAASAAAIMLAAACTADQSPDAGQRSIPETDGTAGGELEDHDSDRASVDAVGTPRPTPSFGGDGSPTAPGGATGSSRTEDASRGAASRPPDEPCPAAGADAHGVTDAELLVGAPRASESLLALANDPPNHNVDEYFNAVLDEVHATGGIACRRVRLVWHDLESHPLQPSEQQAACARWTQDHHVFAAFPSIDGPGDVLYPCLDRAGVLTLDLIGWSIRDAQAFDEVPHLVAMNSPRNDRAVQEYADALVRQRFLTDRDSIGIVHYDEEINTRLVERVLLPALSAHDLAAETRAVTTPRSLSDTPDRDREAANVALSYKLAGVDRVLFAGGDNLAWSFMRAAERIEYRPRYGLHTLYHPVLGLEDMPFEQLVGAQGIGWFPDMDSWYQPPSWTWPSRTRCLDFFHAEGFDLSTPLDRQWAVQACDGVWFLRTAVEATPGPLSADAVLATVSTLDDRYRSSSIDRTQFAPDRRDGAARYRDVAYDAACRCFRAEGPSRVLP